MGLLNRIFVALDASRKDVPLLKHANKYINNSGADKVYFVHVQESLDLPDEVTKKYPDMLSPLDESIRASMNSLIHEHIPNIDNINHELLIEEGVPAETIIKLVKRKQSDIVILGKNSQGKGTGSVARKIASFAPCSVLFAPELLQYEKEPKALIPINFSETSKDALQQVEEIASHIHDLKSMAVNCFRIPNGYSTTGKSYEEMVEILEGVSQKKLDHFVKSAIDDHNIMTKPVLIGEDETIADGIYKTAKSENVDMIIIGSKSRTFMASMVLGSTAEKLLLSDINIPILIYKNKNQTLDIFNFFDRI
ncbi:universal stress protein [Flammeovirga aprica]|uniref:Universal stress protein n=1 Tax=Flammeovirga aprica JL-4 TaxID=694437 RepID=A0A7X9NZQ8_9BACT|nr:universal stress protein [Flammeovirga aprica]NME66665.1 universal stress protein [Flammeovirga aprica JL-4]